MYLSAVATFFLIPPVNLLPMAAGGLVLARWHRRTGIAMTAAAIAGLWILSSGLVSTAMIRGLENGFDQSTGVHPQAIVILSAEVREGAPGSLVPGYDAGPLTLERLRAGARLARQTGLPILTSGGEARPGRPSLADAMAQSLQTDFALPTRWIESHSTDTWQNAALSAEILRHDGIDTVFLVTHAWHMRRALIAFRHAGIRAIAAPDRLQPPLELEANDFVPQPKYLLASYYAIHEWIGCAVYALRDWWTGLAPGG